MFYRRITREAHWYECLTAAQVFSISLPQLSCMPTLFGSFCEHICSLSVLIYQYYTHNAYNKHIDVVRFTLHR